MIGNCTCCGYGSTSLKLQVFVLDKVLTHRFGGVPGQTRNIVYGLCPRCQRLPKEDVAARVEAALEHSVDRIIKDAIADGTAQDRCSYCNRPGDMLHVKRFPDCAPIVFTTCEHCRRQLAMPKSAKRKMKKAGVR